MKTWVALLLSLGITFVAPAAQAQAPVRTLPLVGEYIIDLPEYLEVRSYEYRQDLDRATRSNPLLTNPDFPSELVLVAGRWSGSYQLAFVGVRTQPTFDAFHATIDTFPMSDWLALRDLVMDRINASFGGPDFRIIETFEPQFSTNADGDRLVLFRYRRQQGQQIINIGQLLFIRPASSFAVTFSYDEGLGVAPLMEEVLRSVRPRPRA